jgi:hypothetical protein
MTDAANIEPLILDLLEFLASRERTYEEVMDAWRTSCPRLTVWEDSNERGLLATEQKGTYFIVKPTGGLALIDARRAASKRA